MKKSKSLFIIIFSTLVSVVTMVMINYNASKLENYEKSDLPKQERVFYKETYIQGETTVNPTRDKIMEKDNLKQKEVNNDYNSEDKKSSSNLEVRKPSMNVGKISRSKSVYDNMDLARTSDNLERYFYDNKEKEQSVFKVATAEIKGRLTTSDKIKLLHVSLQLGKEDYKKVEKYLYADDAEDGVLKALKLLKEHLSKKEYEKVRKIAGRFIDMDAAERLY